MKLATGEDSDGQSHKEAFKYFKFRKYQIDNDLNCVAFHVIVSNMHNLGKLVVDMGLTCYKCCSFFIMMLLETKEIWKFVGVTVVMGHLSQISFLLDIVFAKSRTLVVHITKNHKRKIYGGLL
ncbi:hypothetical protein ACJX0J_018591, partial [Zea mays]